MVSAPREGMIGLSVFTNILCFFQLSYKVILDVVPYFSCLKFSFPSPTPSIMIPHDLYKGKYNRYDLLSQIGILDHHCLLSTLNLCEELLKIGFSTDIFS